MSSMGKLAPPSKCKCDKCFQTAAWANKFNPGDFRKEPTNTTRNTIQYMRSCNNRASCSTITSDAISATVASRSNSIYSNSSMVNSYLSDRSPITSFTSEFFRNNHKQNVMPCQHCAPRYYEACPYLTCAGYDCTWQPQYFEGGDQHTTRYTGRVDLKRNRSDTKIIAYKNRPTRADPKSNGHLAAQRSTTPTKPCYPTTTGQITSYTPLENQYHQMDQQYEPMENQYQEQHQNQHTENPYKPPAQAQYYPNTGQPTTMEAQTANEMEKRRRIQETASRSNERKRMKLMALESEHNYDMPGPCNTTVTRQTDLDTRQRYNTTVLAENNVNNNDGARDKRRKKRGKKRKNNDGFCAIM